MNTSFPPILLIIYLLIYLITYAFMHAVVSLKSCILLACSNRAVETLLFDWCQIQEQRSSLLWLQFPILLFPVFPYEAKCNLENLNKMAYVIAFINGYNGWAYFSVTTLLSLNLPHDCNDSSPPSVSDVNWGYNELRPWIWRGGRVGADVVDLQMNI